MAAARTSSRRASHARSTHPDDSLLLGRPERALIEGIGARLIATSTPAPDRLYHYTSQAGLLGIVSERAIRATHASYLNDVSELQLGADLLFVHLEDVVRARRRERVEMAAVAVNGLKRVAARQVFVASFTEHGDQLSQWRGYCPPGSGYAIGFSPPDLLAHAESDDAMSCALAPCQYEPDTQRASVTAFIDALEEYRTALRRQRINASEILVRCAKYSTFFVGLLAATFKHVSFREEAEWRLIAYRIPMQDARVRFREGSSHPAPYVNLVLGTSDAPLLVKRVVIGPTPHPALAADVVGALLARHGMEGAAIVRSQVPYRAW